MYQGGDNEEARSRNSEAAERAGRDAGSERHPAGSVPQEAPGLGQPVYRTDRQNARRQTTV